MQARGGAKTSFFLLQAAVFFQGGAEFGAVVFGKGRQGQTAGAGVVAQQVHGFLHGDGVHVAEQDIAQLQHFQLQCGRFGAFPVEPQLANVVGLPGGHMGQHGDDALAAQGQQGDDLVVVAGVDVQLVAAQGCDLRHLADVAAGFLDGVDLRVGGKDLGRFRGDVYAGAGGHVVHDDRQVRGVGNGGVAGNETGLAGLVVVGGDHQQAVGTQVGGLFGHHDGVGGVVGAGAGDNGDAAVHPLDHVADNVQMLLVLQGGSFAGGAAADDGVGMGGDLVFHDAVDLGVVHAAVGVHGGDHGQAGAGENRCFHSKALLSQTGPHAARKKNTGIISVYSYISQKCEKNNAPGPKNQKIPRFSAKNISAADNPAPLAAAHSRAAMSAGRGRAKERGTPVKGWEKARKHEWSAGRRIRAGFSRP